LLQQSASGLGIDQNLQRHRAVSLRQHGFLVVMFMDNLENWPFYKSGLILDKTCFIERPVFFTLFLHLANI